MNHALLTISEVAKTLRVSPKTIAKMIREGAIPESAVVRINKSALVKRVALERWIEAGDISTREDQE